MLLLPFSSFFYALDILFMAVSGMGDSIWSRGAAETPFLESKTPALMFFSILPRHSQTDRSSKPLHRPLGPPVSSAFGVQTLQIRGPTTAEALLLGILPGPAQQRSAPEAQQGHGRTKEEPGLTARHDQSRHEPSWADNSALSQRKPVGTVVPRGDSRPTMHGNATKRRGD